MFLVPNIDQMYKEMKKIQTGNWSLINLFQLNAYQKANCENRNERDKQVCVILEEGAYL
jgi:hypothetical protein